MLSKLQWTPIKNSEALQKARAKAQTPLQPVAPPSAFTSTTATSRKDLQPVRAESPHLSEQAHVILDAYKPLVAEIFAVDGEEDDVAAEQFGGDLPCASHVEVEERLRSRRER